MAAQLLVLVKQMMQGAAREDARCSACALASCTVTCAIHHRTAEGYSLVHLQLYSYYANMNMHPEQSNVIRNVCAHLQSASH